MPRPDVRVRIAFDLAAGGAGNFFTLDDPVKGELDDAPFGLAGDILEDVTDDVRTVSVRRGRSRELERFQAGAASVVLNSQDRKYDPSYRVTQSATGGDTVGTVDVSGVEYVAHEYTTAGTAAFTPGLPLLRGVQVLTDRVNLARNPSFESNTTGWVGGSSTLATSTVWSQFGSNSIRIRPSGGSNDSFASLQPDSLSGSNVVSIVEPGKTYTISAWVHVPTALSGSVSSRVRSIRLFHRVGAGAFSEFASGTGATTGTTRVSLTRTIPSGVTEVIVRLYNGATNSATNDVYWDGVLIEETSQVRPYFDGGIYDDNTVTATTAWTGTANNSTSTATALQNVGDVTAPFNVNVNTGKVVVRYPKIAFPSPNVASMRPRKAVQITTAGEQVFNGIVDDWDLQYSLDGDHVASVKVTDAFAFLAQQQIDPHTTTAQATGARINAILDRSEIAFPAAKRSIDDGVATLQADAIGGTANPQPVNALQYLQKVDEAEQGALFIAKDGALTFKDKGTLQILTNVKFADDGTGIPFTSIDASYGSEELRNRITVTRLNGGTATAAGTASIDAYGAIDFEIRDSLLADDTQAQDLADQILARYAEPLLRIDGIEVVLNALTDEQVADVLSLDLGSLVQVVYTPSGIGDPIDQFVRLDQIEHNIDPNQHRVRLSFSQGEPPALVLDSATFGLLDTNTLGF